MTAQKVGQTPAKALMLQGTGSDVGKSVIVAGLCRIAARRGLSVAPFKPQNMSNNAAACKDGGEIGRAQALQARACGLAPHVDFNPVLLKPQSDQTAQVVVHGKAQSTLEAADYMNSRDGLMGAVMESFTRLSQNYDLIFVEGAGSPSEINLRDRDIANMGFACTAGVPVCLIGDIERGGVIASLVGTKSVLNAQDAAMITGFMVNKFRGDLSLFDQGVIDIESCTHWSCYGVIPWLPAVAKLPAEDAVSLSGSEPNKGVRLRIAAPMLSRISNFDDADPLRFEPNVEFNWIPPGRPIPRDVDVIMLFGTKSTLGDLDFLQAQGWDHDIIAHARAGGYITGICGGYQLLGHKLMDPEGRDGPIGVRRGLGLLDVETTMLADKTVQEITGTCARTGAAITGYEIHAGVTQGTDLARPMVRLSHGDDGAKSIDGRIEGTYIHGLFSNDEFRANWLSRIKENIGSGLQYEASVDAALDELADGLETALDIEAVFASARPVGWQP